jgi:hypothetical protein
MSWADMQNKFSSLVRPMLHSKTEPLFEQLREFDHLPDMTHFREALAGVARS